MTNNHYFPILRAKAGEFWAVKHLDSADAKHITPIFCLVPQPENSTLADTEYGKKVVDDIHENWKGRFFIYLSGVGEKILTAAIRQCSDRKLNFTVGISSHEPEESLACIVKQLAKDSQRGVMFRCQPTDRPRQVHKLLNVLKKEPGQCSYLLDYAGKPMKGLSDDLLDICQPGDWKDLIAASGTFPLAINKLDKQKWHKSPRDCWKSWLSVCSRKEIARVPSFSDYGTRAASDGEGRGRPSANLRYALENQWAIRIGDRLDQGGPGSMVDICKDLITQQFYDGRDFSAGDTMFDEVAHERGQTGGGALQWVQWSLNHHLVRVVRDLQSLSAQ